MSNPDPIIVARDEIRVELAIVMAPLTKAQRLTFLDILSVDVDRMADRIEMEQEEESKKEEAHE